MSLEPWLAAVLAGGLSAVLTPLVRSWLLKRGMTDAPGERRSHSTPTARGGGLAMLAALLLSLLVVSGTPIELLPLLGFSLLLGALGWLDDRRDLPVGIRLMGMLVCALAFLMYTGPVTEVRLLNQELAWPWLWSALAVVAVIWLINLHNFMDGSDGLAAMQGAWAAGLLGGILYARDIELPGLAGVALAGACLGFLAWNRPPARVFMGDVGSILVGGMIGLLALVGAATGTLSIWISLIICAVFVVDATCTLLRRAVSGAQWYTPHREHAYQRLIIAGWSHRKVLVLYAMINLALVLPMLVLALRQPDWDWLFALLLTLLLVGGWVALQRHARKENNKV